MLAFEELSAFLRDFFEGGEEDCLFDFVRESDWERVLEEVVDDCVEEVGVFFHEEARFVD